VPQDFLNHLPQAPDNAISVIWNCLKFCGDIRSSRFTTGVIPINNTGGKYSDEKVNDPWIPCNCMSPCCGWLSFCIQYHAVVGVSAVLPGISLVWDPAVVDILFFHGVSTLFTSPLCGISAGFSRSHAAIGNSAVAEVLLLLLLPVLLLMLVSLLMLASLQWLVFLPFWAFMPLCDILRLIRVLRLSSLKMVANFSPTFNNNGGHWKSLERCDHQYHWYWWYTLKKKLIWT
jgi:hypothetical protein